MLNWVYFGLIPKLEVPLKLAALPFLAQVCYVFVTGVWEVELLAAGDHIHGRLHRVLCSQGDEVDVHCAQYFVSSSLAPVLLFRGRLKSVAAGTCSRGLREVLGVRVLLSLGGMLFWVMGVLYVVTWCLYTS